MRLIRQQDFKPHRALSAITVVHPAHEQPAETAVQISLMIDFLRVFGRNKRLHVFVVQIKIDRHRLFKQIARRRIDGMEHRHFQPLVHLHYIVNAFWTKLFRADKTDVLNFNFRIAVRILVAVQMEFHLYDLPCRVRQMEIAVQSHDDRPPVLRIAGKFACTMRYPFLAVSRIRQNMDADPCVPIELPAANLECKFVL